MAADYAGRMRKFLLNGGIISATLGILPLLKKTSENRSRSANVAAWLAWGATLIAAISAVREEALEAQEREQEAQENL